MGSVVSPTFRARVRSSIEEPVGRFFGRLGFSPNALTVIGFGIAVVGAYLAASQSWLLAGLVVAFGALFDLFDGALARATGKTSKLGALMDSVFDRAGEGVVYVGLVVALGRVGTIGGSEVAAAAMAASFMVSYTRAKSESLGFSPGNGLANVGLAPREVRIVILVIGLVLAADHYRWLIGALYLITLLATITTIQRILFVYRQSKSQEVND